MPPLTSSWVDAVLLAPSVSPSQTTITVLGILAVVALILLSAFFASSEIAIFSLGDHRIGALVEEQAPGAARLAELKSDPRRLLVTILVGNNIANIGMSAIATGLLGIYFDPGVAVLIATFGITSLVLLFGEAAPKSYAVENSEAWSLRIARPLRVAELAMYPLVQVFDVLTRWVNSAMGATGDLEAAYVSRGEIEAMLEAGREAGVLSAEENRMMQRLIRFRNRTAKEAMVPRPDVVAVDADAGLEAAIETCLHSGHDRLPVHEGDLDRLIGTVHVADLLAARERSVAPSLAELVEQPYVVPETKEVDEVLPELRQGHHDMAIVVDEFGGTAGILTIEDIVEEIIGEVLTETEDPPIRWVDEHVAVVRGELGVHAANEALGIDLPEPSRIETIAGLLLAQAGRLVEEGDKVSYEDADLVAETMDNNRILEVRVELAEPRAGSSNGG